MPGGWRIAGSGMPPFGQMRSPRGPRKAATTSRTAGFQSPVKSRLSSAAARRRALTGATSFAGVTTSAHAMEGAQHKKHSCRECEFHEWSTSRSAIPQFSFRSLLARQENCDVVDVFLRHSFPRSQFENYIKTVSFPLDLQDGPTRPDAQARRRVVDIIWCPGVRERYRRSAPGGCR